MVATLVFNELKWSSDVKNEFRFQNQISFSKLSLNFKIEIIDFKIKFQFQNQVSISKSNFDIKILKLDETWSWYQTSIVKLKLGFEIEARTWNRNLILILKINVILYFIRLLLKLDFDLYHNIKTQARFTHTLFPLVSTGPQRSAAPLTLTSE